MQKSAPQAPNAWLRYVLVTSVVDTIKQAEGLGASVIVPRIAVPTGAFAILADPTGAIFGVFEQTPETARSGG